MFAEYNKWDEYGIALPFKDMDMRPHERLIDCNGTSIPWSGPLQPSLERYLVPRCLRFWEGSTLAYAFYLQYREAQVVRDIVFEQEVVSHLGGLGLVRLEKSADQGYTGFAEVEGLHGRTTVRYSPEMSNALMTECAVVPIMWQFRRCREGASDRYKIVATRFRLRNNVQELSFQHLQQKDGMLLGREHMLPLALGAASSSVAQTTVRRLAGNDPTSELQSGTDRNERRHTTPTSTSGSEGTTSKPIALSEGVGWKGALLGRGFRQ